MPYNCFAGILIEKLDDHRNQEFPDDYKMIFVIIAQPYTNIMVS